MLAEKKEATIQKHGTAQGRPGKLHAPAETTSDYKKADKKKETETMLRVALGLEVGVAQPQASLRS
jgi:hypothetical protein